MRRPSNECPQSIFVLRALHKLLISPQSIDYFCQGDVTLFGSKVSGGPFYDLELFNGNTFNTFKWNTALQGDNIIKVTQLVDGRTILVGNGSGKKKIPCS